MAVFKRQLLLEGSIFHFHDYGRKGRILDEYSDVLNFGGSRIKNAYQE